MRIVLASASAYRARLLRAAGVEVDVVTRPVDEAAIRDTLRHEGATAEDAAVVLAEVKARRVAEVVPGEGTIVLGFDQILDLDGEWLGKAASPAEARGHLLRLRGRMHRLVTAAVAFRDGARIWQHVEAPRLWLRAFGEAFLDDYLARAGDALVRTVGAYEYEALGAQLMRRVEGDYFTVLGLPLLPVLELLREQGALRR